MDINQLRCFMVLSEELHFGRAAQKLEMMPASLSRFIRLLEEELGQRLLNRSTRNVALTPEGAAFLQDAAKVVKAFDELSVRFRGQRQGKKTTLRIGAIDSAARGLLPQLLHRFRDICPEADVHLTEDKTTALIPRLKSGWLDLIFVRPPETLDVHLTSRFITSENCVLAVPADHPLAAKMLVTVSDFLDEPMIVPERRSRPHSHDLTINLFKAAGAAPHISHFAEEKQTILSFVSAGLGLAIVPASYKNMNGDGVSYIALRLDENIKGLPLSAIWLQGNNHLYVNALLALLASEKASLTAAL
ncbi:LysR family transcriptional regulator [Kalamiella sp. sgz302252]|uniref:LysR family transcriptional regulator n=1 Tax=Pantoea sp. sgz302252 TaxID=3341827 RepID=UPI0036D32128